MSEPEKYTLPRVLEIVRGHAEVLGKAGAALDAVEGDEPAILAMVGEQALAAAKDLWKIEDKFTGLRWRCGPGCGMGHRG